MANEQRFPRQWDDGLVIRQMTSRDADTVIKWYGDICLTSFDLSIALDVSEVLGRHAGRFLVGELNGSVVASGAEPEVGNGVAYGSLFYVEEKLRSLGFGRRIFDAAAEVNDEVDHVVAIDAHDELEAMYQRRGYKTAFKVTQYVGTAIDNDSQVPDPPENISHSIKPITDETLESVLRYDDQYYVTAGSEWRRHLLHRWVNIPDGLSVVAMDTGSQQVVGYGCRRPDARYRGHIVGPLYAENSDIARSLLTALLRDIKGQTFCIHCCELNDDAVNLVSLFNLKDSLHMLRMYRNENKGQLKAGNDLRLIPCNQVFAITSVDVCGF